MKNEDLTLFVNPNSSDDHANNDDTPPDWFVKLLPGVSYYPHVKLGDAFVPYAFGSDTGALLIYPIFEEGNLGEPVRNLLAAKDDLQKSEPDATLEMILVKDKGWLQGTKELEDQGIHCFDAPQFLAYAINFFSETNEQCRVGKIAFRNGDYEEAFANLNVDNPTDPEALYMLGYMYEHGQGVERDRKTSHSYYWKAALQGNAPAHDALEDFLDDAKRKVEEQEEQIIDEITEFTEQLLKDEDEDDDEWDEDDVDCEEEDEDEVITSNANIRVVNVDIRQSQSNCSSRSRQSLYGMLAGSCSQNVIVESGRTLEIAGSCSGNVRICPNATLICHGLCSGNVEIERNGRFVCNGSMSGNIRNRGGFVEILGSFLGRRTDS